MQKHRRILETLEERNRRRVREAQMRRDEAVANEAAVDRMIKRNVEQYGP
jgi:flagellar biosynthesis chaperone FliJ